MAERWFYAIDQKTTGPIDAKTLFELAGSGKIRHDTLVWQEGTPDWIPASSVSGLFPQGPPGLPPRPPPSESGGRPGKRGTLGEIGAKLSEVAELPTITNMPVRDMLVGGLQEKTSAEDIEEIFAAGTAHTTPDLESVTIGWPRPRVFWRIFLGAVLTYVLLWIGVTHFGNANFLPGMIAIGSFVVPFSVVVFFFEMNTPRNVSVYQVGKMLLFGGAISLVVTVFLFEFVPGTGVGALLPALLTGVTEETGKALALLIMVGVARYRWQLNGLLLGAAVGAGFAGFESAGYAYRFGATEGLASAIDIITLRGLLTPGGHVIWTAMIGSAIWKVKADQPFQLGMLFHPTVVRRWFIAVVLHGLWDAHLYVPWQLKDAALIVVGWYLILAILKQALEEVEEARKGGRSRTAAPAVAGQGGVIASSLRPQS